MIDITQDYYNDNVISSLIETYIPKKPRILYPLRKSSAKKILKKYKVYEISNIKEMIDNYDVLNEKTSVGFLGRIGLSNKDNKINNDSFDDVELYNAWTRAEKNSRSKNLNYCVLEDICLNIAPKSFLMKDSFELCELQLMQNYYSTVYIPSTFVYLDNISGNERENLKNAALLEILLESDVSRKYDITLQTMDEDYPVRKDGMTLFRGKRFIIRDINLHDEEGYHIPDYHPLLVSVF